MKSYLQDLLERISAAACMRTFDDRVAFMETLRQRATFRAIVRSQSRGDVQGYALRRNINTVTMLTYDVLLCHCSKMTYTESIRVAYSYLLYTLGHRHFNPMKVL